MPLYEYGCPRCRGRFERLRPVTSVEESVPCPSCSASAYRLISLVAPGPRGGTATATMPAGGCCGGGCACGQG